VTPEQAEKLALAVSEGRLQLVMRNSTDQDDAPTPGANKRSLLSGEQAVIVPEAGSYKSEQQSVAPGYASARAGVSSPRRAPVKSSNSTADAVALTAPTPLPRRSVELYEGAKKRDVDFP